MEFLWNHLNRNKEENVRTYLLFLLLHTLLWILPIGIVTAGVCLRLSLQTADVIRFTGLIAGYPGLVVGFFGGLLYLLRNQ